MKAYESNYGTLFHADNHAILKAMPDNSIEALVTDPPYGISFMGKKWDYDVPAADFWEEVHRVMKPGAHGLVACGTRTQHRMAVNLEDAGFEIRDLVMWVYGSGFPKSLNVGKAIDQIQGNEREIKGKLSYDFPNIKNRSYNSDNSDRDRLHLLNTRGTSEWEGWGTALKPSVEIFTLIRKPISEKNIAENVLKWGTGGINIDGCRVESEPWSRTSTGENIDTYFKGKNSLTFSTSSPLGRFPANFIHDGSEGVTASFPETSAPGGYPKGTFEKDSNCYGKYNGITREEGFTFDKGGSAARFFYCAKASASERNEGLEELEERKVEHDFGQKGIADKRSERQFAKMQNHHPTVKPIALMQYLTRLITPPGGTVLDPFAGSGTTGIAAINEGFKYLLIEREEDYIPIITARLTHWEKKKDHEPGDLFEEAI